MDERRIAEALREATDTQQVVIGDGVLESVADVFARSFEDSAAVVVADENTWQVAGEAVNRSLQTSGREVLEAFVFPGQPTLHAEYENIEALTGSLRGHRAIPVAVVLAGAAAALLVWRARRRLASR